MPGWKCKLCTSTSSSTKYRQKIGTGKGNSEVRQYLKDLGISKSIFPEDFICSACHMKVRQNSGLGKKKLVPPKVRKEVAPAHNHAQDLLNDGVDDEVPLGPEEQAEAAAAHNNALDDNMDFISLEELMDDRPRVAVSALGLEEQLELDWAGNRVVVSYSQEAPSSTDSNRTTVQGTEPSRVDLDWSSMVGGSSTVDGSEPSRVCLDWSSMAGDSSTVVGSEPSLIDLDFGLDCLWDSEQMDTNQVPVNMDLDYLDNEDNSDSSFVRLWMDGIVPNVSQSDTGLASVSDSENMVPDESISTTAPTGKLNLPFQSVLASQTKCFVCLSNVRNRIPAKAIMQVWIQKRIRIPLENRCCPEHLENKLFKSSVLETIVPSKQESSMTAKEIAKWITELTEMATRKRQPIDFDTLEDENFDLLTGLTASQFQHLFNFCKIGLYNSKIRTRANALGMYLIRLRLNVSYRTLGFLFGINPNTEYSSICDTINRVRELLTNFSNHYIGYNHTTAEDLIENHSIPSYNQLYGLDADNLVLILDGTYIYCQKPTEFYAQWLLYSMQKKRHLAKFMMIITTTGYILEVAGPYGANSGNNDAGILAHMPSTTPRGSELLDFVDPEKTAFIVDRGFRDVEESAKEKGFQFFKPSFLGKKQKQFTTSEANDSRLVTMVRWKVEAINGLFKNKFSFFDGVVSNNHLLTMPVDLRIACALINAYCPPLKVESPENVERVQLAIQAAQTQTNSLQKLVEELKLDRGTKNWEQRNKDTLQFPELSFDDLEKLTLGVFQKNMAKVYSFNHLRIDPDFTVDLHKTIPNLIRCKVQSKYSKNKKHYAFVQFDLTKTGHESITRCYCKCNNGTREVGKCSHSTTLLFYFGLARHHPAVIPRKRDFCAGIIDAGRRLQDPESSSSESEQDDES